MAGTGEHEMKSMGVEELSGSHLQEDNDAHHLRDLGYDQQLKVGTWTSGSKNMLMLMLAQLRILFQPRSGHDSDGDLGSFHGGFRHSVDQWWPSAYFATSCNYTPANTDLREVALVYGFIFCFVGTLATCASLAEYASILTQLANFRSSVSLGHRVGSEEIFPHHQLDPRMDHLLGLATHNGLACLSRSHHHQALLVLNYRTTYMFQRWHGTLIYLLITWMGAVVNVGFARWLPRLEGFLLVWHILGFFAILIPLVYLAPEQNTASFVWTSTADADAWPNYGIALCIGVTTSTFPFVGYDAASHMAEEVHNPKVVIPRAMIGTILINGLLGFGMIIALLFSTGDPTALLESPVSLAGYPFIQIYYNAVQSLPATNAMTAVSLVIVIMANFGLQAGCSRTVWAFARDKGLPASRYLEHVSPRSQVPFRAVMLSVAIQSLLGLINIGSSTAFNAFVNSAAVTLYITYITPVILGVLKRMRGEPIPYGPFSLGKYRNFVNGFAIVYTLFTSFFLLWPIMISPTAANMNWSIVLVGAVVLFSIFWWFVEGRKSFDRPNIDTTLHQHVATD
ncbi:hypothetical protein LTR56_004227 [Elasticomyces elasticus]|nr:hypothetical protein LTR56_004227 [Elasticomyces elasticus]KAK3655116.1 hypothetical protein LTR22_010426 [Elasticomyces elasticus]KAK4907701.1 hypothetical protein LTR49_023297 [Elasticomyces elasticus]KAK5750565.1 hypothetical protein LTS12_019355 [Elasticomyces elasticus]